MAQTEQHTKKNVLVNSAEALVKQHVADLMAKTDMCRCEKCFLDACALVFNQGFVHFTTTHQGHLLAKVPDMKTANHVGLIVAVTDAVEKVRARPMHDMD